MATTMRKDTRDKQYQLYLSNFRKGEAQGNIVQLEFNGSKIPVRPLSQKEFDKVLNSKLKEMSSTDSGKYKLGETIYYELSAQYSKKQMNYFRRELGAELSGINMNKNSAQYKELMELVEKNSYMSKGQLAIRKDFFDSNIALLMDLFFGAGGHIGES